jgi:hypothetical protein
MKLLNLVIIVLNPLSKKIWLKRNNKSFFWEGKPIKESIKRGKSW